MAVRERKSCFSFSNLGLVNMPEEFRRYVDRLDFVLGSLSSAPYNTSAITSSSITTSSEFTITVVLKGNGSNGAISSTLTFTLIDSNGAVIATGSAGGVSKICPPDGKDTTYSISFTFVDGKTWSDVSNLKISFADYMSECCSVVMQSCYR